MRDWAVMQVGAGSYSWAALSSNDSKTLYMYDYSRPFSKGILRNLHLKAPKRALGKKINATTCMEHLLEAAKRSPRREPSSWQQGASSKALARAPFVLLLASHPSVRQSMPFLPPI